MLFIDDEPKQAEYSSEFIHALMEYNLFEHNEYLFDWNDMDFHLSFVGA